MSKKRIVTNGAYGPTSAYSQGVVVGKTLYVQGVIALLPVLIGKNSKVWSSESWELWNNR